MGFAVICDAQKGEVLGINKLALVDRYKTREIWWTSDSVELIMHFRKKSIAQQSCDRFKHNNPKVVSFEEASTIVADQNQKIINYKNQNGKWNVYGAGDIQDPV